MGKTFVITEVRLIHNASKDEDYFGPVNADFYDRTWIDPRHVIDEKVLRRKLLRIGTSDHESEGWSLQEYENEALRILLDPPKEEKEWERWLNQFPYKSETSPLFAWLRRMPRPK